MEEDKSNIYNEIIYYFKEIGLIIYSEYTFKKRSVSYENILPKYSTFLNDEEIKPLIKSKINHQICYHYYNNKGKKDFKLSINLNELKVNYYNFILICNLVHYYNEYYDHDSNKKEVLFLIEQMKKFSIIIFKGEGIKEAQNRLILILLFLYYYSILAIRLDDSKYIFKENYEPTSSFFDFIQNRVNSLLGEYIENDSIFDNDFINLNLDSLNNYSERKNDKQLEFFTKFIKFVMSMMGKDKNHEKQNFDFSMIQNSIINVNVRFNLALRKAFFDIINSNNIESSLEELKKIKENDLENEIPEIEYDYYMQIIKSNANLLSFTKNKIDINKENINKIKNIPNLSEISKIYHEYNLKVLENDFELEKKKDKEKRNPIEEEMEKNIFFKIICIYNDIALKTKDYKNIKLENMGDRKKNKKIEEIFEKVESFCKELEIIEDEDEIDFISKNEYLKILISRIFYNYFALKTIVQYEESHKVEMKDTFESFKKIVDNFRIENFLVDKIKDDYSFINEEGFIKVAKYEYAKINNITKNECLSSLLRYADSSDKTNQNKKKIDEGSIHSLRKLSDKLSDKYQLKMEIEKLIQLLNE